MNNKLFHIILFCNFIIIELFAQDPNKTIPQTTEEIIENYIEEIIANTDKEIDLTSLYEDLTYFLNEPLNLNTATKADLEKLQLLSEFQINSLLQYIKDYGPLLSIYELLNVNGYNEEYVRLILPFIKVEKVQPFLSFDPEKALKYGKHKLFIRTQRVLQQQVGFSPISDSALAANPNARYLEIHIITTCDIIIPIKIKYH